MLFMHFLSSSQSRHYLEHLQYFLIFTSKNEKSWPKKKEKWCIFFCTRETNLSIVRRSEIRMGNYWSVCFFKWQGWGERYFYQPRHNKKKRENGGNPIPLTQDLSTSPKRRGKARRAPEGLPVIKKSSHANPRNVGVQATARRTARWLASPRPASPAPTALPPTSSSSSPRPLKAPAVQAFTPLHTTSHAALSLLPWFPSLLSFLFSRLPCCSGTRLLCSIALRLVLGARESSEACPFRFRLILSSPIQSKLVACLVPKGGEIKDRGETAPA